jgi:DUF4097 and DUF4098 domain-containing protein YvlB
MKAFLMGALAFALPLCAIAAEHKDTWQRTFPLAGSGEGKLAVEIINGNIQVVGDNGRDIRVTVNEEYRADRDEDLATVRNDFKLQISHEGNSVRLYLDPPKYQNRGRDRNRMHFRHDIDVLVPREIAVSLRTINGRELSVAGTNGHWSLKNINGAIEMKDMAGYGEAETLNGALRASFARNPSQASKFKNLNGVIDVSFQPDLSADLALSTMNGDAYTDFEIAPLAVAAEVRRSEEGFRYRVSDRNRKIRIGGGGVEHSFSTLNGSIKIRKYGRS